METVICRFCSKSIQKKKSQVARYAYFFCDKNCRSQYYAKLSNIQNIKCHFCLKDFSRKSHAIRTDRQFCSNFCKNSFLLQNKERENPLSHRKRRETMLTAADNKCQNCLYSEDTRMLDIHHFDGNHQNNAYSNFRVLCVWCHILHHRTGIVIDVPVLVE